MKSIEQLNGRRCKHTHRTWCLYEATAKTSLRAELICNNCGEIIQELKNVKEIQKHLDYILEVEQLFEFQRFRIGEATRLWRAEDVESRRNVLPDLGSLVTWLIERGNPKAPVRGLPAKTGLAGSESPPEVLNRLYPYQSGPSAYVSPQEAAPHPISRESLVRSCVWAGLCSPTGCARHWSEPCVYCGTLKNNEPCFQRKEDEK